MRAVPSWKSRTISKLAALSSRLSAFFWHGFGGWHGGSTLATVNLTPSRNGLSVSRPSPIATVGKSTNSRPLGSAGHPTPSSVLSESSSRIEDLTRLTKITTPEVRKAFAPLIPELRAWYEANRSRIVGSGYYWEVERVFGKKLAETVCRELGWKDEQCVLTAIAIMREEEGEDVSPRNPRVP